MKLFINIINIFFNIIVVCSSRGDLDPYDPSWMDPDKYFNKEAEQWNSRTTGQFS